MNCPLCERKCLKEKLGYPESPLSYYLCRCATDDENFELYTKDNDLHSFSLRIDMDKHYMKMSWIDDEDYGKKYKIAIKEKRKNEDIHVITRGTGDLTVTQAADMLKRYFKLLVFI